MIKVAPFASDIDNRRKGAERDGSYGASAMEETAKLHHEPAQQVK